MDVEEKLFYWGTLVYYVMAFNSLIEVLLKALNLWQLYFDLKEVREIKQKYMNPFFLMDP